RNGRSRKRERLPEKVEAVEPVEPRPGVRRSDHPVIELARPDNSCPGARLVAGKRRVRVPTAAVPPPHTERIPSSDPEPPTKPAMPRAKRERRDGEIARAAQPFVRRLALRRVHRVPICTEGIRLRVDPAR